MFELATLCGPPSSAFFHSLARLFGTMVQTRRLGQKPCSEPSRSLCSRVAPRRPSAERREARAVMCARTEPVWTRRQFCFVFPPSQPSLLFPVNTSIPNVTEVKENMTFGATLVTNPKGGFLVRKPGARPVRGLGRPPLSSRIRATACHLKLFRFLISQGVRAPLRLPMWPPALHDRHLL